MTLTTAIILCVVCGFPLLVIGGFFAYQWWKKADRARWKHDQPNRLMIVGGAAMVYCLLVSWADGDFMTDEQYLSQPKTIVSGMVEEVDLMSTQSTMDRITVKVDGSWYTLVAPEYPNGTEPTAKAAEWVEEAIGQQVTLEVYPETLYTKGEVFLDTLGTIVRGEIYGITDSEGTVILDAETYRNDVTGRNNHKILMLIFFVFFALLLIVGAVLKFVLKW